MFKIGSHRLTWMALKFTVLDDQGHPVDQEIKLQVHLVDRSEMEALTVKEREQQLAGEVPDSTDFALENTHDWKGVAGQDGKPLPFSKDHLRLLMEEPGVSGAWGVAYLRAWQGISGIREKKSNESPADGQEAAEGQGTSPAA